MLFFCLIVFLGEISGGGTLSFSGLPGTGNVNENSPAGTSVYTFSVDLTPDLFPNVAVGYPTIINSNPLTKAFEINPVSSVLYKVVTTGDLILDYETMPHRFELQILVYDTAGAKDLQILTIQVLDVNELPVFQGNIATQLVTVYILENTPSGPIYSIDATDSTNATSAKITYSLTPDSLPFGISETGTIYSLKKFDYEKDPDNYTLQITARDRLGQNVSRTVIVSIINTNDEPPYFTTKERAFKIPEESMPGSFVANITVKDPDGEGYEQGLRFSINNPPALPNFSIDPVYGTVLVAKWLDRDIEPWRDHPNISLVIRVVDSPSDGRSDTMEIVITIEDKNDNPPECQLYNYRVTIPETELPGSILNLRNFCEDIDVESPNNVFNFTGLSGIGSNKFTQDPPGSGNLQLIGSVDLENENRTEYKLNIVVQDIASPYFAKNIYIYVRIEPVNEFKPVFNSSSYVFNVSETRVAGSIIGNVHATDQDLPGTGISYSLLKLLDVFWIDSTKGSVGIVAKLDYETNRNYTFTVQASDNDGKFATASVTVNVLEENDEPPICSPNSYLLEVPVDLEFGTNINGFILTCEDKDSSPKSFRYSINSGNVNNHFTFSPSAGSNVSRLMLALPFDYEGGLDRIWDYRLLVFITDDNLLTTDDRATSNIQTGTVTLTIRVIPKPTTVIPTTPGVTIVTRTANVYSASAWYVPFIIVLGSLLLLGLLGYLSFLLVRYIYSYCARKPRADKKPLIQVPDKKKAKKEVVWEMTNINTIFDGEAKDPVTGKWYEYNSKSGARRWKDPNVPSKREEKEPVAQKEIAKETTKNVRKKEAETSGEKLGEQNYVEPKPLEKKTEALKQKTNPKSQKPKEEPVGKSLSSPIIPRKSPSPSPKVYPKYGNQPSKEV
nr:PREDICTED: cadherin-related family member 3 [Anolis carolinensis]|eukprot:XP_008109771.2 PREDICTED: cadherin-related family member 3 [Anolis carolinensis]